MDFVDRFMPKHTHYQLTKIEKVKKHNRAPLIKILYYGLEYHKFYHKYQKFFGGVFVVLILWTNLDTMCLVFREYILNNYPVYFAL